MRDSAPAQADARFVVRIAASMYESLLLAAIVLAIGFVALALSSTPAPAAGARLPLPSSIARLATFAAVVAACGIYCVALWRRGRRTLPMKTWRLALVDRAGGALDTRRALVRYGACWTGPLLAIVAGAALRGSPHASWAAAIALANYAWAAVDADRRFLQDRIAGTRLVRTPRTQ